jgi:hypothetical protein
VHSGGKAIPDKDADQIPDALLWGCMGMARLWFLPDAFSIIALGW